MSTYLTSQKENLKKIVTKLSEDFKYVSILAVDTKGKKFGVSKSGYNLGDSMWTERGFVIRVHNGVNYSEYSFNAIDEDLDQFIDNLRKSFKGSFESLVEAKMETNAYDLIEEDEKMETFFAEVEIHPQEMNSKDKMDRLSKIMKAALASSDDLVDFRVNYEEVRVAKMFLSTHKDLEQAYAWSQGFMVAISRRDDQTKFFYDSSAGLKGLEILDELEGLYPKIVEGAVKLLDAQPIEPGEYDIICAPDVSGLIAHEAFGHGVEMDMFVKNRAKAVEYLNKPVGSAKVSMHDGAAASYNVSSYLFDDEGILGSDTKVIDQGILKTGISDVLSAMKLGTQPTGNGKRESFERKAYARMTSTFFTGGQDKLEDMIASIEKGYLLEGVMSGMEDPKNWGIQCMLVQGKEIIDGKLTGKIVSPVIMTGYVPDVLNSVDMVSEHVKIDGSGTCGKGHKEWVKTADGGPYIKAKGRLG